MYPIKEFSKTGTRESLIPMTYWISHSIRPLSAWSRKVRSRNLLRTTNAQLIIPIHNVEQFFLFESRCSGRLDKACCIKVTFQSLFVLLFWVLCCYISYRTKGKNITYMEISGNFWNFWISYKFLTNFWKSREFLQIILKMKHFVEVFQIYLTPYEFQSWLFCIKTYYHNF